MNPGSPSQCSRSCYLLNNVHHKKINHANPPKRVPYTVHIGWWTAYQHMIHFRLLAYEQFARMTMEPNVNYSVWQVQCLHLHIIFPSKDFQQWSCSPYKLKKTWFKIFHSYINVAWFCNLRFDYSKTFGGFTWLHVVLNAPPMPSQRDLKELVAKTSALISKSWLWDYKSIKFLWFFYCPPQPSEK